MSTFILIVLISSWKSSGMTSAEFQDRASCENAITEIKKIRTEKTVNAICVPKEVKP